MGARSYGVTPGVATRDGQGGGGNIGGVNCGGGKFFGEGNRNAPGAGTDVGNSQTCAVGFLRASGAAFAKRQAVQRYFDHVLGFRPGNQNVRADLEFQSPKFLFAGEVLRGLTCGAASEQSEEMPRVGFAERF